MDSILCQVDNHPRIGLISNVILSAIVVGLLWQLLLYRQVEFLANKDVYLYVNDKPGQIEKTGLKADWLFADK
jgi:hypothetical protein